jgi:hypothetical protein
MAGRILRRVAHVGHLIPGFQPRNHGFRATRHPPTPGARSGRQPTATSSMNSSGSTRRRPARHPLTLPPPRPAPCSRRPADTLPTGPGGPDRARERRRPPGRLEPAEAGPEVSPDPPPGGPRGPPDLGFSAEKIPASGAPATRPSRYQAGAPDDDHMLKSTPGVDAEASSRTFGSTYRPTRPHAPCAPAADGAERARERHGRRCARGRPTRAPRLLWTRLQVAHVGHLILGFQPRNH